MTTNQQTVPAGGGSLSGAALTKTGTQAPPAETSLTLSPAEFLAPCDGDDQRTLIKRIPIEIDVAIPIPRFQVRNVLALAVGQVIGTGWVEGEDVPLAAHGAQLAWTEIEVIDQKLAVRITRLS
jgi:flagellar motor switch protein FliN/FliY